MGPYEELNDLRGEIRKLRADIKWLGRKIGHMEEHMAGELDRLTASVAADTDAENSAITLLGNLSALIKAAGTDPVKLAALADTIDANKTALAAAVVANTPAA